jgi:hypothetical protein
VSSSKGEFDVMIPERTELRLSVKIGAVESFKAVFAGSYPEKTQ